MIVAWLAAAEPQLQLTAEERQRLTQDFLTFQEIYAELVGPRIRVQSFDGHRLTLTVAAFPEEGRALRTRFQEALIAHLGKERFEQVDDYLGQNLDLAFRGFGITSQTIDIVPAGRGEYQILWKATVVDGLTVSGVPESPRWTESTGTSITGLSQMETGPLRYLAPVVRQQFGPRAAVSG